MSGWTEQEEDGEDLPDEQEVPSADGEDDGFDDVPATHMEDAEYEEYVASEFDAKGREKSAPPVTAVLIGLTAAILVVWWLVSR